MADAERGAMPRFDYDDPLNLLTTDVVRKIAVIHECKGKQALYLEARPDVLDRLCTSAKIRSADASNRIEGISTSPKRLNELMAERSEPVSRAEREIAGYRDALALIHESYEYMPITPNVILQLHAMLHRYSGHAFAGRWRDSDNAIVERNADGTEHVRFRPLSAVAVPGAMDELCASYASALEDEVIDPLILIARFVFDFVSIHPFTDGNGRMSRLLTLLLLYQNGYSVGKYVSIEEEINRTRDSYYEALAASSEGWGEGKSDYTPFVNYLLGVMVAVYADFESRVTGMIGGTKTKAERVEEVLLSSLGKVTKSDIALQCPDISVTTIERVLKKLLDDGKIEKVGKGRTTAYVWQGAPSQ